MKRVLEEIKLFFFHYEDDGINKISSIANDLNHNRKKLLHQIKGKDMRITNISKLLHKILKEKKMKAKQSISIVLNKF